MPGLPLARSSTAIQPTSFAHEVRSLIGVDGPSGVNPTFSRDLGLSAVVKGFRMPAADGRGG